MNNKINIAIVGLGQVGIYLLNELNIKFSWKGNGIKAKCYNNLKECIIESDKEYYRPLEVDTLLGNANKAKKELKWKPKTNIKSLVKEMVSSEMQKLTNGQ